jgi:hypothetical protein
MGATEEQMALVAASPMDHVSYILVLYSVAFIMFLFVMMLITLYDRNANGSTTTKDAPNGRLGPRLNGQIPVRDAQEFELEGLMSDEDEDRQKRLRQEDDGLLASPSTLGKNDEHVAR